MKKRCSLPKTKQDLADAYGVSLRTINNWLAQHEAKIGSRVGHVYTPKQIQTIYNLLGSPSHTDEES